MREAHFIKLNKPRWEAFEKTISQGHDAQPDELASLFVQVTDDLSFARTQYPHSRTTQYLNALAGKLHLKIYKNKREDTNRLITFWKNELPDILGQAHRPMFYALVIFLLAVCIGALSTAHDDTFVRLILGDEYVNMTIENIKSGNPTQVYSSSGAVGMFFSITQNNIMVSFMVFVYGVLASVGTGFYLFKNGLMVGTFLYFFYQENELAQALPVIMLHGTIELSSIVIAGGAGFMMGNSLLFPGTYSRLTSFKMGALKGLKIVMGLVPFFILAGFIESFITRYAFMHWSLKFLIIGTSAFLMIYYFVVYPYQRRLHGNIYPDRISPAA